MLTLYPPIKPYKTHTLQVDNIHNIYIEECGVPDGIPVVFLHGGPGAGTCKDHRRFFDPYEYRIILFDQRGCGKSTPYGELENNSTASLVHDMEKIRNYLKIDKWLLFGGSWGSTLALLYAQSFPNKVIGLILRGVFLSRNKDIDWLYQEGASRIYPDFWTEFLSHIPKENTISNVEAYYNILHAPDEIAKLSAAKAWSKWEAVCSTLEPCNKLVTEFTNPHAALALAKIESHYFFKDDLVKNNNILNDMPKISNIPGIIVHGRYDIVCPLESAYELKRNWANAELEIIRDAGHSAFEPGIVDALIHATKDFTRMEVS